jgi:hypothetical protein
MTENQKIQANKVPTIGDRQIELLEKLCNATAVSGDEQEVRQIVLEEIKPVAVLCWQRTWMKLDS